NFFGLFATSTRSLECSVDLESQQIPLCCNRHGKPHDVSYFRPYSDICEFGVELHMYMEYRPGVINIEAVGKFAHLELGFEECSGIGEMFDGQHDVEVLRDDGVGVGVDGHAADDAVADAMSSEHVD